MQGLFNTGAVVVTEGASKLIRSGHGMADKAVTIYLHKHMTGDWGDMPAEDTQANEDAIGRGGQIMSSHRVMDEGKIWIITSPDRRMTTILTPQEY